MAIATSAAVTMERIKERWAPTRDRFDQGMRQGRRMIDSGQHAFEDAAATTARNIRRRPLTAVAIAAFVGALVGSVTVYGFGRLIRK
jgi:ElaB/YqjD/DUF883 family membrane-anchored ribosome-binding protein